MTQLRLRCQGGQKEGDGNIHSCWHQFFRTDAGAWGGLLGSAGKGPILWFGFLVAALSLEGSEPEQLLFKLVFRLRALYAGIKYSLHEGLPFLTGVNKAMPCCSSDPDGPGAGGMLRC